MNGKMTKMLCRMLASKEDIASFKKLTHHMRGLLRTEFESNTKLAHPSFKTALAAACGAELVV
jgi:hypothetical protein